MQKGIDRNTPSKAVKKTLRDFTSAQKQKIFEQDNYKCVICGLGSKDGVEIHADHIKPKELGGQATVSNGQTLCSRHKMMKKTLKETEIGKKMFINFYEIAKKEKNKEIKEFCSAVLQVYENHKINGHIKWKK